MTNGQATKTNPEKADPESGTPGGGAGRKDEVGKSGVYPVSEMKDASADAVVHGESSFGQGERGAEGYKDAGSSGVVYLDEEKNGEGDDQ